MVGCSSILVTQDQEVQPRGDNIIEMRLKMPTTESLNEKKIIAWITQKAINIDCLTGNRDRRHQTGIEAIQSNGES